MESISTLVGTFVWLGERASVIGNLRFLAKASQVLTLGSFTLVTRPSLETRLVSESAKSALIKWIRGNNEMCNECPGVDVGWPILFAIEAPRSGTIQAERWVEPDASLV